MGFLKFLLNLFSMKVESRIVTTLHTIEILFGLVSMLSPETTSQGYVMARAGERVRGAGAMTCRINGVRFLTVNFT